MSIAEIEQAQRVRRRARARFEATLAATQDRLRPGNLANEAWDGVKEKSASVAEDAVDAVKQRPATVGAVLGALALFLARKPVARAVGGVISRVREEIGSEDETPALERTKAPKRKPRSA